MDLSRYNAPQLEAIKSKSWRILVLAGAGSGKTSVLTGRMAYLIENGVNPGSIMAVTFTNKAAGEMKSRVESLLSGNIDVNNIWMGTFHGICNRIIRSYPRQSGLSVGYQIIDPSDQKDIIQNILEKKFITITDDSLLTTSGKPNAAKISKSVLSLISYAKSRREYPENLDSDKVQRQEGYDGVALYQYYQEALKDYNVIDFDDILLKALELFENHIDVRESFINKFSHVLVDEFQDTSLIQYEWLKILTENSVLFVVGDDDQGIYSWRGAKPEYIIGFDSVYEDTHVIKLEQNYRSTQSILDCANASISYNETRKDKKLFTTASLGTPVKFYSASDKDTEASRVVSIINDLLLEGFSYDDFAILYRSNYLSLSMEKALRVEGIPYKIIGGINFYSRKEIKDVLSYMSFVLNPHFETSFNRSVSSPSRGIGKKTKENISLYSKENNLSILDAVKQLLSDKKIKGKSAESLKEYVELIDRCIQFVDDPEKMVQEIVMSVDFPSSWNEKDQEKLRERKENLESLYYDAVDFNMPLNSDLSKTAEFLSNAALLSSADTESEQSSVQLMTIHASKGLEFPVVFLVGAEDGVIPPIRSLDSKSDLEEERRLMYVAITRAQNRLYISSAQYRPQNQGRKSNQDYSKFIEEIIDFDSDLLDVEIASRKSNTWGGSKTKKSWSSGGWGQDW